MSYEVELKVRADHDAVRDRLADADATALGAVVQVDAYFDHPGRSFAETDEALRVRRERDRGGDGETAALTYKGPLVEAASKTRREVETAVEDPEAVEEVLEALDFPVVAEVRKDRERFAVGEYTVTLDAVEGLGEFVEVEARGGEGEIEALREGARDLLEGLGLDPDAGIRTSYLEMLLSGRGE